MPRRPLLLLLLVAAAVERAGNKPMGWRRAPHRFSGWIAGSNVVEFEEF
jgi:hypothetical protein